MALGDTINGLLERQRIQAAAPEVKSDLRATWMRDVDGVMDVVRATLAIYVKAGQASVTSELIEVREDMLGAYSAQRLVIGIAGTNVIVEPVARFVFGATGRIDLYREHRSSEDDRLFILRPMGPADERSAPWLIETRATPPSEPSAAPFVMRGSRRYLPFNGASIESAVDHLLTMG